jgi:hypothetical protein
MQSPFDCVLLSIRNSKTGAKIMRGAARFWLACDFLLCFDSVLIYLREAGIVAALYIRKNKHGLSNKNT